MEIYKTHDGTELAVLAATWEVNSKMTFETLVPEFRRNSAQAWRNYGSRVTGAALGLAIRDPEIVQQSINIVREDPFDYAHEKLYAWLRGQRGRRYFMHFDLAKNKDRAGFALVHREPSGVVVVDFMHAVSAKPGQNIDFEFLRTYVYELHARGFAIEVVSYDQWQSEDSRQQLEKRHFKTDYCSADKTPAPYDTLIDLLTSGRLDYYNHPLFLRELKNLRTNGLKYDHPKGGSKDVADAVACASWMCLNYELENPKDPPGKVTVIRRGPQLVRRYEKSMW